MNCAIHSVFILKENILFLEQWIDYHRVLGFTDFYLYDNSKSIVAGNSHYKKGFFVANKVNKYGVDYDKIVNMNDKEINDKLETILNKYKNIQIIEWSPANKFGKICHNQVEAHNNCIAVLKSRELIEWCAVIDMDEYIVLANHTTIQEYLMSIDHNISNINMSQYRFGCRFKHLDKLIVDINLFYKEQTPLWHSNKNIFRIKDTTNIDIHQWNGKGLNYKDHNHIWFNHYKDMQGDEVAYVIKNNINSKIKSQIYQNAKNYIRFHD